MDCMTPNLEITLATADKRLAELLAEYDVCLYTKAVSPNALQLTHDICGLLRSVLDRTARLYFELHVSPSLTESDRKAAAVYFPITETVESMNSTLGRWRWKSIRHQHQPVCDFLLAKQPFVNPDFAWLNVLNDIAVAGKHIDLIPQTRTEERRTTVTRNGGGLVSYGRGVTFGSGATIMGAPVDPRTQRIVPTESLVERIDVWVSFLIKDHNVDAGHFCKLACAGTRLIASEMTEKFGLS
jgi:hypothetical protein